MASIVAALRRIIEWAFRNGLVLGLIVAAFFLIVVVRPFSGPASDPDADDLAVQWNSSIARLGITPVFPPEEDLYVGDLWAVVSHADKAPMLGRSVRIGHLDLRAEILQDADRPIFADTTELKAGDEFRHQDEIETTPASTAPRIRLTIAAFPGVSISHVTHAASAAGTSFLGFGGSRDNSMLEELRIPVAETYGVRTSTAAGRLIQWCEQDANKLLCTDAFARRLLAFTLGDDIMAKKDGAFTARLELQLVTRVYLTRTIEQHRQLQATRGALLASPARSLSPPSEATDKTASPEARARDAVSATQDAVTAAAKTGAPSLETSGSDIADVHLQQTFQRPVVFGFRSWNIELQP